MTCVYYLSVMYMLIGYNKEWCFLNLYAKEFDLLKVGYRLGVSF
jgi:hypothetical protein